MIAATQGAASPDAVEINARAEALAANTGNLGHLAEQIVGSWMAANDVGNFPSAMVLADRLLDIAQRDGGAVTRGLATRAQLLTRYSIGDLLGAEEHFVSGEAFLSDPVVLRRYSVAAPTICHGGYNVWTMDRADEARARMRRAAAMVEDDACARTAVQLHSSCLHALLREPEQAAMLAAQASATAAEHGFRYAGWLARIGLGWAQAQLGHPEEGTSLIREALAVNRANGYLLGVPMFLTLLAEAQALGGALADSLRTFDEALTVNPNERFCRPETLRLRGEIRRQQGDEKPAEADFHDAIALAREMSAKAWELRAATSLARLWRDQGRRADARSAGAGLWLVHRRLRHRRSERRQGAARRAGLSGGRLRGLAGNDEPAAERL
jgi:tetratricopeptide (TPR) repeat protein